MDLKQAYQMVFDDLHGRNLFQGRYDAFNGNPYFMYGIGTVMEVIAKCGFGEDFAENFSNEFTDNMLRSRENV